MRSSCFLWACALASVATAQASPLPQGYQSEVVLDENSNPFGFYGFAVGGNGLLYAAVQNQILEIDALGNRSLVYQLPSGSPGAIAAPGNGGYLYFTDVFSTSLWRFDLISRTLASGSAPGSTFDMAVARSGELLVSANPNWQTGGQNGIWLVDFQGGAHREIITLSGPSGPLLADAAGNLYYGEVPFTYPPPAGSVRVLHFEAARVATAIQGGPPLTTADATTVLPGLDGAYDLAFDDRAALYISDPINGGVLRTRPGSFVLEATPLVPRPTPPSFEVPLQLQFADLGPATFDPFQPDTGAALYATFTDFAAIAEVRLIRPVRPVAVSSPTQVAGPGPIVFQLSGLPANGPAALYFSPLPPVPERSLFRVNGAPVWSGLNLAIAPVTAAFIAGPSGAATLNLHHPGGFGGTLSIQTLGVDAIHPSALIGTSAIYLLTLTP